MVRRTLALVSGMLIGVCPLVSQQASSCTTVTFASEDGVACTADLYAAHSDASAPFIVLFHQASYSRGEYREIAPRLNRLGFNCMAVDARSGSEVNGVKNETAAAARAAGKPGVTYADALPDLIGALKRARKAYAKGKLIAWGSSYSASLVLQIAGTQPGLVDGVLAFSPGEYFLPSTRIADSVAGIRDLPVFVTSGPYEEGMWKSLYEAIPSPKKTSFLPAAKARLHGSSALWATSGVMESPNPLSAEYWKAVEAFLGGL